MPSSDNAPVLAPVNVPLATVNLLALSSQPINWLESEPLSITIPTSLLGLPDVPFANSIKASVIVVFVEETVDELMTTAS